ncbi:monofunctional biosynthetic peptidoglycan transglycosylase [Inhella gelatinilytica]|uniref:Biosynthetic peptidoglycan transglycosylase n=1 Tax=Inhella gelatinilytica TaxID=2795030 RepID=A0A931IW37_9BURK|nr:monofunctional biosynthetic peptidoglycan transglycosylase [Inhella gelatinilytica]MBH9553224.1 monofunctional biosynthetic peptidoglycan transglycosylase [Inhella gelatinilytica]
MKKVLRLLLLATLLVVSLQLYFAGRIGLMALVDLESTTFQRSEAMRLLRTQGQVPWRQEWQPLPRLSPQLARAVIASEDAGFAEHGGIDWDAVEKAWERNEKAEARAAKRSVTQPAKVVGGSTLTQQLAKNLFLSGERHMARKAQEALLTLGLELFLSKERILELYLNHVEWGEGVFGAEAAARHYFRIPASQLSAPQAARLAVMLPAPKRFEKRPTSPYLLGRSATIQARMPAVELP